MPDETVLRFVLEEDTSRQAAAERERALGPQHPGFSQPVIPLTPSEYERRQFGGLIPSPPPPGTTGGAPITGTIPPVERLAQAAERLAAIADQRARPPIVRAAPRGSPFAEEESEQPGDDGASALAPFAGAVGPFAGAIATRVTGSATIGGFAGMGATRGMTALAGLGPAGMAAAGALAGVAIGATAAKEAFGGLVRATEGAAESVRGLSPDVAGAYAERRVADIQMRLRRGEQIGMQLAGFVRAQTGLEMAIEDLKTDLIGEFAPLLKQTLEGLTILIESFGPGVGVLVKAGVEKIEDLQNKVMTLTAIVELINQGEFPTPKKIRQIVEDAQRTLREDNAEDQRRLARRALDFFDPKFHRADLENRLGVEPLHPPGGPPGIF